MKKDSIKKGDFVGTEKNKPAQEVKKTKKKDYDMEYEAFDDTEKKGFFSWLRRK